MSNTTFHATHHPREGLTGGRTAPPTVRQYRRPLPCLAAGRPAAHTRQTTRANTASPNRGSTPASTMGSNWSKRNEASLHGYTPHHVHLHDGHGYDADSLSGRHSTSLPHDYDYDYAAHAPYGHADDGYDDNVNDADEAGEYLDNYRGKLSNGQRYLGVPTPREEDSRGSKRTAPFAAPAASGGGARTGGRTGGYNAESRRPSTITDTPSMYSDPYEYQSTAAHTAMAGTVAGTQAFDPYGGLTEDHRSDAGADANAHDTFDAHDRGLIRKDTLRPGDSISAYNVPISTALRNIAPPLPSQKQYQPLYDVPSKSEYGYAYSTSYDADQTAEDDGQTYRHDAASGVQGHYRYDSNAMTGAPGFSHDYAYQYENTESRLGADASDCYSYPYPSAAPHRKTNESASAHALAMAYADDEYDQDRQIKEGSGYYDADAVASAPPGLFSNQMAEMGSALRPKRKGHFDDEDEELMSKWGLLALRKGSLETQIENRRRGIGRQRLPIVTWIFVIVYVALFIVELIKAKNQTGQSIQTKPYFNPMIGPSTVFQISFGARFVPCMRNTPAVPLTTSIVCPSASTKDTTSYLPSEVCPLWEICGLPNDHTYGQQYRLILPMFLHAGFVHIFFNLAVQLTLCAQIEKLLGSIFYTVVYVLGGLGGNLLGGNFGLVALPSVGASGAIYSCIAVELVDLVYNWRYESRAKTRLVLSIFFTLLGLGLGLLPGLDNFAHIGGFAVGLLGGMTLSPSIHETKRHRLIIWVFRLVGFALCVAYFVVLGLNFYKSDDPTKACTWCRYLSCIPTFSQCKNNGLSTTATTSSGSTSGRRDWSTI